MDQNWKLYQTKAPVTPDTFQKFISSAGHLIGNGIVSVGAKISGYFSSGTV